MKRLISIIILLAAIVSCNSHKHNFSLDVQIKEGYDYNGRWAYLTALYDNEYIWLDSVLIDNNVAQLRGKILYDEYLCELLIEDEPRTFNQFVFAPNERVSFTFDPESRNQFPFVVGSTATIQIAEFHDANNAITNNILILNAKKEEIAANAYSSHRTIDSLLAVENMLRQKNIEKAFNQASSFLAAYHPYLFYQYMGSPEESSAKTEKMLKRWKNSVNLSMITTVSTITGDSITSQAAKHAEIYNRRAEIVGNVPPYVEVEMVATPREEPYMVGDTIESLTLPMVGGGEVTIAGGEKSVTLIDFWASWCVPCREEMPDIIELQRAFSDQLKVVMISMDTNINNCKHAIKEDDSDSLVQTILRSNNPLYQSTIEMFNIKSIPRNLLINSNGEIVAENLHGEELRAKIEKLCR